MVDMGAILDTITSNHDERGALKSMRSDMRINGGLLDREQHEQFVRELELNQTILYDAAFKRMNRVEEITSGTRIIGRVLQDGYLEDSEETNPDLNEATIGFGNALLTAKKLKAKTSILDDDLEDNIERESFQNTLQSMMAARMGADLEAIALFGDSSLDYTAQPLFHTFDGWLKMCTNKLESSELAKNNKDKAFNVHENTIEALFDALIRSFPVNIRQSGLMDKLVIYVPWEVEDAYRNLLKSRNTPLGDSTQTGFAPLYYKKFPIKYCPTLDSMDCRELDNTATCMAAIPDYLRWGVYKDIKLEAERKAAQEKTNFYYV